MMDPLVKTMTRILKRMRKRRLLVVSVGSRITLVCPPLAATPSGA
jgi:hypothetical protein